MKVAICGGRDRHLTPTDIRWLNEALIDLSITEIAHGAYGKTDWDADKWALFNGFRVGSTLHRFPPDWQQYGKPAGPMRNTQIADWLIPDGLLIAFPGGSGTADMIRKAEIRRLEVLYP